jgi:hypothetical protein
MSEFNSNKNKEFIWDFLVEQNMFNGVDPKYKSAIQDDLQKIVLHVSSITHLSSLIDKNKEVIKLLTGRLNNYKNVRSENIPKLYKSSDIQAERQNNLEKQFKLKQEEMNQLLLNKPKNIKFSEDIDRPLGDDMDKLIEQTLAKRKLELNQVLESQDVNQAAKWIGNGNDNVVRNLKIGDNAQLEDTQIIKLDKKQVTFDPDANKVFTYNNVNSESNNENRQEKSNGTVTSSAFLSKLKKAYTVNKQEEQPLQESAKNEVMMDMINKKLDLILSQQREILEKLSSNKIDNFHKSESESNTFMQLEDQ